MATRHDPRRTHVRPRPPSTGRPAPVKVKPRTPTQTRVSSRQPIRRTARTPLLARVGLIAALGLLGVMILFIGMAGIGGAVGGVTKALGGFVANVTSTPTPKPSVLSVADAPILDQPTEPYTSDTTANLVVTVPSAVIGDPNSRIKVYLALPDQQPTPILEVAIADTAKTVVPVELADGINDFSVTIIGPGGESDHSAIVRYVLDTTPPKITITSPKNNSTVNRDAVEIKGKVQARTTLIVRNQANGASVTSTAASDGTFDVTVAITTGSNKILLSATDPAGNTAQATLTVTRGAGKLTVKLSSSDYSIKRGALPEAVTLSAVVNDPDGNPVANAALTFTISMPGIPTVSQDTTTDNNGRASFKTTIPKGAQLGAGSATVLATTDSFGSTQDYTVITIVK